MYSCSALGFGVDNSGVQSWEGDDEEDRVVLGSLANVGSVVFILRCARLKPMPLKGLGFSVAGCT